MRVIDVGLTDAQRANGDMDGAFTKVGFPSEGRVASGNGDSDRTSVIDLATNAAILEFGMKTKGGLKRWPFMSNAMRKNKRRIEQLLRILAEKVYKRNVTAKRALGIIGEDMVGKIKQEMRDISTPQEEDATIKRKKGVSNPTIDTGQMINSVTHVEVKK
jgi:hypothetical protein